MPGLASPSLNFGRLFAKVRRRAKLALTGEVATCYFDIDDRELVSRIHPVDGSPRKWAFTHGRPVIGERLLELREDLRTIFPLGLTPAQRGDLFQWFCKYGDGSFGLEPADVLRHLFEMDATPDRGLVAMYRVQPSWQTAWPDALTPSGWESFKQALAAKFNLRGRWLRRAKLPMQPHDSGSLGVNAIGLFRYNSGLKHAAQGMVDALASAGVQVALRDVPMPAGWDGRPRAGFDDLERFPITLVNTGLDLAFPEAYRLAGLHPRPDTYRIAVWFWELEQLPQAWLRRGADVDEIWAPTRFIADAMRVLGKPVFPMLPSVHLPTFDSKPKAACGLDPGKFTFLFTFDMNSRMPRKNPLGLIEAFRLAFSKSEPVELAIKMGEQDDRYSDWWRDLRLAAALQDVTLIDRSLPRGDLLALMNAADAYVSLHRSEGLGLTMAEAMLLGKPTIATGYSGNLDFMTPENSYLVSHAPARIADDVPPYPKGCVWAEPSVEDAARQMRRVYDQREEAAAIAARGRADVSRTLSTKAAAKRMVDRLKQIPS